MNWNRVKTVTIFILIAVNIFFVINLVSQYRNTYLIDDDSREKTTEILKNSGISVAPDVIPGKKPTQLIYENPFGEDYHKNIVTMLAGTENCTWHMINNGTKCILSDSGDEFEFSDLNRFEVTYKKAADLEFVPDAAYISAFTASGSTVYDASQRDYGTTRAIRRFLFSGGLGGKSALSSENAAYDIKAGTVRYDTANDWYVVTAHETIDSCTVYSRGLTFVVYDGEVIYMTGELMLLDSPSERNSRLLDQINILFEEKSYIESLGPTASAVNHEIISMSIEYCVSWNSDRTSFYLIPAWKIVYSDGTARLRNAINGSIYTI